MSDNGSMWGKNPHLVARVIESSNRKQVFLVHNVTPADKRKIFKGFRFIFTEQAKSEFGAERQ